MELPRTRTPVGRNRQLSHARGRVLVILVLAATAFGAGCAVLNDSGTKPVRLAESFTGTVSQVDNVGSAICVIPHSGGEQRCSVPLQRRVPHC